MNKQKIKILSGHSAEGGSTTIWINLTNLLNENGYDATFYGPHEFHLDKCKSGILEKVNVESDDILICHIIKSGGRPPAKKVIYASHEKWWGVVDDKMNYWDIAVFNHQAQKDFHKDYTGPYVFIPNPKEPLVPKDKPELDLIAGVIGTVEERKQTHKSIERAFADGCTKVKLYGVCAHSAYYDKYMREWLEDPRVEVMNYTNKKQEMYDSIGRVYHSSIGEVSCLVKDECSYTNTKFFGNEETEHLVSELSNQEILKLWEDLWK